MMNKGLIERIREALTAARQLSAGSYTLNDKVQAQCTDALGCLAALEEDEKCNGWSNHETWTVHLWLTNDQGTYNDMLETARTFTLDSGDLAQSIKDYCEQLAFGDEAPASMATDLLRSALGAVNWQEVARAIAELEA